VPILERSRVTGLGLGTKTSGLLSETGMQSTLETLAEYRQLSLDAGAPALRSGATMAVRMASNSVEFCERAAKQGTPIDVISGELEADLGFSAVGSDPLFARSNRLSIIDPGGHSTELVTSDRIGGTWNQRFRHSFAIGALGMREEFFPSERATPEMIMRTISYLDDVIGLCYLPNQSGAVVSLGATGTNLITIREHMLEWDSSRVHGQTLDYEEVSRATQWLMEMSDAERAAVPGIEPGRERSLHIGALILERFMFALRAESCVVSTQSCNQVDREQLDRIFAVR